MNRILAALLSVFVMGCMARVPPGYVGMKMTRNGSQGQVLAPGMHDVYGRDRLVLLETKEQMNTETLSILCKDDLNFSFDLKLRAMLNAKNSKIIREVLNRQGANIKWDGSKGLLGYAQLYKTYVQPLARSIARGVVSKYMTTEIRDNRDKIQKEIQTQLHTALKGTPMSLQMVATSNFDYPKVITQAVEKKRKRELQIEEERANRETVRVAEAEAESAYNQILGRSLTPNYLKLRELENQALLYKNTKNTQLIITDGKTNLMPVFTK